mmetsp:Transcript_163331/g.301668  ORF Transcript_163331/g.301668 Transcript_163331/m.301668 type:complete len:717 (+) Transcript_163331:106-2256(+)
MCEYAASCDARALHIGSYSAWLTKVKGDGARAKWFNNNTTRYFTIDFDSQLFYYSHNEERKKISSPVRFNEILHAEQLPRPAHVAPSKNSSDNTFGFIVQTPGRTFELYTLTYLDAKHWVDALIAARDIANRVTSTPPVGADSSMAMSQPVQAMSKPSSASMAARELSRSSMSTTADGSDSGRSNSDREPLLTRSQGYGSSQPPPAYAPPAVRPPVAYAGYGPQPSAAPLPRAPLPASSATAAPHAAAASAGGVADVDPFAALDALEELAGPLPDQSAVQMAMCAPQQAALAGEHLRQARQLVTQKGAAREAKRASAELRRQRDAAAGQSASVADANAGFFPTHAAAAQPAASLASAHIQQHNASADNWDSDEEIALLSAQGPAPQQSPQRPAAMRASPPRAVAAAYEPLTAPLAAAPAAPMPAAPGWPSTQMQPAPLAAPHSRVAASTASAAAVNNEAPWDSDDDTAAPGPAATALVPEGPCSQHTAEASGWDSDDDHAGLRRGSRGAWGATPAQSAVPLTQNPTAEASGWDSDEDITGRSRQAQRAPKPVRGARPAAAPLAPAPLAPAPLAAAPRLDACGAPLRPAEAFVTAKKKPVATTSVVNTGDDLDDLVGEVLAADTTTPSRGATSGLVPGFHCTGCDFQVLRIDDYIWNGGVEYMFFRNNYPNVGKLRAGLVPQRGCCAYCCQCSWKSAESAAALADVAEGLRWRSLGF